VNIVASTLLGPILDALVDDVNSPIHVINLAIGYRAVLYGPDYFTMSSSEKKRVLKARIARFTDPDDRNTFLAEAITEAIALRLANQPTLADHGPAFQDVPGGTPVTDEVEADDLAEPVVARVLAYLRDGEIANAAQALISTILPPQRSHA
jgi:hypothetical protein